MLFWGFFFFFFFNIILNYFWTLWKAAKIKQSFHKSLTQTSPKDFWFYSHTKQGVNHSSDKIWQMSTGHSQCPMRICCYHLVALVSLTINKGSIKSSIRESCSVVSDSLRPHGLNSPWNSPGKNTWVASSQPRDQTQVSRIALQAYSLPAEPQGKPSIKMILNFIESIQHTAWHTETFIVDTGGDITYCYYFCGLMFSANPQFSSILSFQLPRYKTTSNHYYGEGNGNPLQYSCLENPMDRGAWWAPVCGVAKSQTRLSH